MNVHLLAIVGGSGSGKTWLTRQILDAYPKQAGAMALDDFYRDLAHVPMTERERVNFDNPAAIDWELFQQVLVQLRAGQSVNLPMYDFATHTRRAETQLWRPRPLVVLDGLWLLHDESLRDLYSLSAFVDCPEEVRLARRIERDQRERGRSIESIRKQFHRDVAPMHGRFVQPQADVAHLVVKSNQGAAMFDAVRNQVERLLGS